MLESDVTMLQGIVEADECYVGGKPRKSNRAEDRDNNHKRGRRRDRWQDIYLYS